MWRFLRNLRLILRLHYYLGTHILGASRGGPCDSTALVSSRQSGLVPCARWNWQFSAIFQTHVKLTVLSQIVRYLLGLDILARNNLELDNGACLQNCKRMIYLAYNVGADQ